MSLRSFRQLQCGLRRCSVTAASSSTSADWFRTTLENPADFTTENAFAKWYTIRNESTLSRLLPPPKPIQRAYINLPHPLRNQFDTLGETSLLAREPLLEFVRCAKRYEPLLDAGAPPLRFVIHGRSGSGKTTLLTQLAHYGLENDYVVLRVTSPMHWTCERRHVAASSYTPEAIDHPLVAQQLLYVFLASNRDTLQKYNLCTTRDYKWTAEETTREGSPIAEMVEFGAERPKLATDIFCALLRELRLMTNVRRLIVVDQVNAIYEKPKILHADLVQKTPTQSVYDLTPLPRLRLTVTSALDRLFRMDWNGAIVAVAVDELVRGRTWPPNPTLPQALLGREGFAAFDPFVPLHVKEYSREEGEAVLGYYEAMAWLQTPQARSPQGKQQLLHLAAFIPSEVERIKRSNVVESCLLNVALILLTTVLMESSTPGDSHWEVAAIGVCGPCLLLIRNVVAKGESLHPLIDALLTVVAPAAIITVFSNHIYLVMAVLLLCAALLARFGGAAGGGGMESRRLAFITSFRSYVYVVTCVAILAVDFPAVFPHRFSKSLKYGYGLMDTGVGAFVFVHALVERRTGGGSVKRTFYQSVPLLMLGFLRLAMVRMSGYHEVHSEYGRSWNFFFTLCFVKFFTGLFNRLLSLPPVCSLAFHVLVHELLLHFFDIREVVLHADDGRQRYANGTLLEANLEGIASLAGYLAIYHGGAAVGAVIWKWNENRSRGPIAFSQCFALLHLLLPYFLFSFGAFLFLHSYVEPACRVLANTTYVMWIIYLSISQLAMFSVIECFSTDSSSKLTRKSTARNTTNASLYDLINRHGLLYFCLSNVLTGIVNLTLDTNNASPILAFVVLVVYLTVTTVAVLLIEWSNS